MKMRVLVLVLSAIAFAVNSEAQLNVDPTLERGLKPYGSFEGGSIDSISTVNGSLNLHIPLVSYPQRGGKLHFGFYLDYITGGYTHTPSTITECTTFPYDCAYGDENNGAALEIVPDFDFQLWAAASVPPPGGGSWASIVTPDGAQHEMGPTTTGTRTIDATGYLCLSNCTTVVDRDGIQYSGFGGIGGSGGFNASKIQDPDGNYITPVHQSSGATISYTDTMGRSVAVPFFVAAGSGPTTDYTDCTGGTATSSAYNWVLPGYQGQMTYKICRGTSTITSYQCIEEAHHSTCQYVSSPFYPIQSIVLPNNTAWTFAWDNAALIQITFPTGGYIKYTWSSVYYCQIPTPTTSTTYSGIVTSRIVNANDGTGEHTWTYSFPQNRASPHTTSSTDPLNQQTIHTVTAIASTCSFYETQTQKYDSVGNLVTTVKTDYTGTADPMGIPPVMTAGNVVPIRTTTTWPNGSVSKVETDYDAGVQMTGSQSGYTLLYGIPVAKREYDYSSGALLRETFTNSQALANSNYLSNNLLTLVSSEQTCSPIGQGETGNCAGNTLVQRAYTQNTYDQALSCGTIGGNSPCSSGISTQHGASPDGVYRGNLTTSGRWLNTTGTNLNTTRTYFDTGTVQQATDPAGHVTTYAYSSTYVGTLPTTITNALSQPTTNVYDLNTGLLTSNTDPNLLVTNYGYDSMWRLSQVNRPDGGQDTVTHQETSMPFSATATTQINVNKSKVQTNVFDGLGRVTQTKLSSDPQGTVLTDTTYDGAGHVATVSNPYRTGTDPTSSPGITIYAYDAMGRKTKETYPDNSILTTAYCGPNTLVTDPTGKWRRSRVNGLGQLVEVDEPNSTSASVASTGCPGTGEPIWVTSYTNDALGNLKQVVQNGSHTRTFTYDSLSRLLTANNPENGTITYTYNSDNTLLTKKDARNITANYAYDALHRETGITYSNSDPALTFTYDETGCLGLTACQNIGHRTSMTDGAGSEKWAYQVDPANLRSLHREQRTTNSSPSNITKTTSYNLDLAGNVTQLIYPTGRIVNYTYDAADRPSTATDSANGITYATAPQSPVSGCLASAVCYTPQGSVYSESIGRSASFTGFNFAETYNSRLQPLGLKGSSSVGNAMDITYSFVDPVSLKNAGHVYGITNTLNSARSQSFTYDQLSRIVSAGTSATTGVYCWGYQYSYDAWGNLLAQSPWAPTYNACSETTMAGVTADGSNHISGFSYDTSGNTLGDGTNTYTWDGESQMKTAAGITYAYDGDGRRVAKVGAKLYWYGSGGEILAETNAQGNTPNEYIFFGGKRVAQVPSGGTALFYAEDLLGSTHVIVQSNGTLCYDGDFTPYGAERAVTHTCPQNYKFEGKERDTETGNDEFGARAYTNRFGRWLSSDWSAVPVPVPYANLNNPQTLNLYAMTSDDPESFADLDGHAGPADIATDIAVEIATYIASHPEEVQAAEAEAATEATAAAGASRWGLLAGPALYLREMIDPHTTVGGDKTQAQLEQEKQQEQQASGPQTSTSGGQNRQGGGRNAQKSNVDRVQSAKDKVAGLKSQRDQLASKANKTPKDKADLKKLDNQIKRETQRQKKSENDSRKHKGQQQ